MTTYIENFPFKDNPVKAVLSTRFLLWLVTVGVLATLLTLLSIAVEDFPDQVQDINSMDWAMDSIVGWDFWGVSNSLEFVSAITGAKAGAIYGGLGIIFLLLLGKYRPAMVFTVVCLTIGNVAVLGDATLGEIVDRGRPLDGAPNPTPAFPSGHVFGSAVFFGFMGFLGIYYQMKRKILLPMLVVFVLAIVLVGPARVHVQAHFASDVVAGYLLAAIWLLLIIPVFIYVRGTRWMSAWQNKENSEVVAYESCMVASSISSVVVLDPEQGTATKVYVPPPLL